MVAKINWHRYGTKLHHCHPVYISFCGHLNEIGTNRKYRDHNGYHVTNDVTVWRRSFYLHTFSIFLDDKMPDSVEMHVFLNFIIRDRGLCPSPDPTHHFSKWNFFKNLNFTIQINVYQEGTKINAEVNDRPLKNIGTHWYIRHHWFQRVPISFSLAKFLYKY